MNRSKNKTIFLFELRFLARVRVIYFILLIHPHDLIMK